MCSLEGCGSHAEMPPLIVPEAQRRDFLRGLIALPLAAVLSDKALAEAAASSLETVSLPIPDGQAMTMSVAVPAREKAPVVILIHEWWGLNDQIRSVAAELAKEGYLAICVDLYGGKVATDAAQAKALMDGIDPRHATQAMVAAVAYARAHPKSNGKVATCGWCFGGGWSLNASLATPVDATVIYYGYVKKTADQLKALSGPVLGHFAKRDTWIDQTMVSGFEAAMREAGKAESLTVFWYESDHAFANPTGARYDAADASLAWGRTLDFLKKRLV